MNKSTIELMHALDHAGDMKGFLKENEEEFLEMSLAEYVEHLLEKYQVKKSQVLKRAKLLTGSYRYEVLRGEKCNPDRELVIKLCFGFPLDITDAQRLLRLTGVAPLYPRNQRDAYILFALKNGYDIDKLNDILYESGEKTIDFD